VPFDPDASGVALLLIDSHARHRHAGGEYAARRASCERAANDLDVVTLRDVQDRGPTVLDAVSDPVDARRAHHVLSENQRVLDFVAALTDYDFERAGRIVNASHASMRDDFEITTEQIDLITDTAIRSGALGARMTGGGFGGCVIALVLAGRVAALGDAVRRTVSRAGYPAPTISRIRAGPGGMRC
jgi:galactokinase